MERLEKKLLSCLAVTKLFFKKANPILGEQANIIRIVEKIETILSTLSESYNTSKNIKEMINPRRMSVLFQLFREYSAELKVYKNAVAFKTTGEIMLNLLIHYTRVAEELNATKKKIKIV